jgi:hypothetical protein
MILIIVLDIVIVGSLLFAARRRVENALPLVAFFVVLMPLEARIVLPGLCDLDAGRVAVVTLLGIFVVRREYAVRGPVPLQGLMCLHCGWALCSTVVALSVATSIKQVVAQVVEYYALYYVFVRSISRTRTIYAVLYAITIAMGVCSLCGLLEAYASWSVLRIFPSELWTTYDNRHDPLYIEWGRGLRIRATFPHPILFGDALAMTIPVALYLLSVFGGHKRRVVLWSTLALMLWAVYKTSSRGPWIAVAVSSLLLVLLVRNRVRQYVTAMAAIASVVLVARPGVSDTILNLYHATQDHASIVGASYDYRHALNQAIADAVAAEPVRTIVGYGLGSFRERGLDIYFSGVVQHYYTCDNNWALFVYETGYGGLLVISLLLLKPVLQTLRQYRTFPRPGRYLCGVFFISLMSFYFLLLSVAGYSWGQQGFMAWILIALSVSYSRIVRREQRAGGERISDVRYRQCQHAGAGSALA